MPEQFWAMTWNDYHRACQGFYHRQELEWERTRYVAAMIFNANSKKSKTPQELVPLNLDKQRKQEGPKIDLQRLRAVMQARQEELNRSRLPAQNGK